VRSKRPQDAYGRRAKREGFAARSVYKLEEIHRRVRLFRQGQRVLDLGAFPGSWTQFAAEKVGGKGVVVGIDRTEFKGTLPANARMVQGDVTNLDPAVLGDSTFDAVISDMAPNTSGDRTRDMYLSYELVMAALEIAKKHLVPGGTFVAKIFQGGEFEEARARLREVFDQVRIIRPKATRSESYEVFLIGLNKHSP
jgi:23S rRNA (uridine2552-2'-O)-methyltransferase